MSQDCFTGCVPAQPSPESLRFMLLQPAQGRAACPRPGGLPKAGQPGTSGAGTQLGKVGPEPQCRKEVFARLTAAGAALSGGLVDEWGSSQVIGAAVAVRAATGIWGC